MITLKWKRMGDHDLPVPRRAMPTEAGHDLAVLVESRLNAPLTAYGADHVGGLLTVYPGALLVFRTGWAVEIPPDHFGLVHVRSSIGKARWVLASSGVVDPSYRGEVMLPLLYLGTGPYRVRDGDRMAQMMIVPRPRVEDVEVDALSESTRGEAGFGSTGR
jgi:dUTP pyrophosphatase